MKPRVIYVFEFADNSAYIGLTHDPKARKSEHLSFGKKKNKSSVLKHIKKTNLHPEFKIVTDFMDEITAIKKEFEFIEYYKTNGWTLLNRAKAGSIGGKFLYWTKDRCIEDAKKFTSRAKWAKTSTGAWESAKKYGWLKECYEHMKRPTVWNKKWTLDKVIEVAKKCKNNSEMSKKFSGALDAVYSNNWSDKLVFNNE
jgi:predicted GIY-YIG superfamily endonuclease